MQKPLNVVVHSTGKLLGTLSKDDNGSEKDGKKNEFAFFQT